MATAGWCIFTRINRHDELMHCIHAYVLRHSVQTYRCVDSLASYISEKSTLRNYATRCLFCISYCYWLCVSCQFGFSTFFVIQRFIIIDDSYSSILFMEMTILLTTRAKYSRSVDRNRLDFSLIYSISLSSRLYNLYWIAMQQKLRLKKMWLKMKSRMITVHFAEVCRTEI